MQATAGRRGAAQESLIRWKLTAGPEGGLLSNTRTQPASHLPLSRVENPLPPSNRSLIQVNKSLFKCRVFLLPFRNLNFDIWSQNRWTCFILSHSKETVVLSGCYLISLLFWGLPLLKTKRGKGRSIEGRFWPLSSFSLNTYLHTVARDGWKGTCVNNILGTFGKRHF